MADYTEAEKGEIRADLEAMYTAGRKALPSRAKALAGVAQRMSDTIATANSRAAQMGDHTVLIDVLDMAVDCQAGVARSVETLNNLARGVVAIADDFVERDDYARSVFHSMSDEVPRTQDPIPNVPTVPDKDRVTEEGDGSEYEANPNRETEGEPDPNLESPDDERDNRDDQLEDDQADVPFPED